jgi:anti-sigma regulatory factor (Ser/Thr protein kinase)/CheY-like chemotaxis protein
MFELTSPARDPRGAAAPDPATTVAELAAQVGRLEDQLLHATCLGAVGELAGHLLHDFNNLLAIAASSAQLARRETSEPVRQDYLREIEMATDSACALAGQMLALCRTPAAAAEPIDAAAAIERILPLLRRLAGPAVTLALIAEYALPPIGVEPSHLEQMLLNLVTNARDALPDGGHVVIRVTHIGDDVSVAVRDTGHGMDARVLERAVEPYFTTKPRGRGTGLGLPAVRTVAERYHGTLQIESVRGHGTTVACLFPVTARPQPEPGLVTATGPADGPVLLVEDEPALCALLTEALRTSGLDVRATDGQDPDDVIVAAGPYRLVVSDMGLRGRTAAGLLRALRDAQPGVPILCTSGHDTAEALADLLPGVVRLRKPFNIAEFDGAVGRALTATPPRG